MSIRNTTQTYGAVTRVFHWLTALLILTALPLGLVANALPYETGEELARKALIFSMHKTVGVLAFWVAVLRILWALVQTKPAALHPERRVETKLAETVHWLLYASLVIVPLSGWIHHAATSGFAPIWWPFGQNLPLVPKSEGVAHIFASLHYVFTKVLAVSVILHVAGALKHQFVDRDATLPRMWRGTEAAGELVASTSRGPVVIAAVLYLVATAGGTALGLSGEKTPQPGVALAEVETGWQVQDGAITISVVQLDSRVSGRFADWTASIDFDETVSDGRTGSAEVTISIPSLALGSVARQAMGADFFNAEAYPTANFTAELMVEDGQHRAEGTLTIKDASVPVSFPYTVTIEGDTATVAAETTVQRLDFGIGRGYPDETSVGFDVDIAIDLTATRN